MSIFVWLSRYLFRTNSNSLPEVPQSAYPISVHCPSDYITITPYACTFTGTLHPVPHPPPGICAHLH